MLIEEFQQAVERYRTHMLCKGCTMKTREEIEKRLLLQWKGSIEKWPFGPTVADSAFRDEKIALLRWVLGGEE